MLLPVGAVLYGFHLHQTTPTVIVVVPTASPSPSPSPSVVPPPTPSPSPSPVATAPPASFFVYITQSDYGYLAAQTLAGATCNASATFVDGSTVPGIHNPKVADAQGMVWWWYTQLPSDQDGTYTVSCTLNGEQAATEHDFSPPN